MVAGGGSKNGGALANGEAQPSPMEARAPRLALTGISMRFGRTHVLEGADLIADRGEIVGLSGDNGAGKSTLVKILAGVFPVGSYGGTMAIDGRTLALRGPSDTQKAGITVVHQKPMLVPQLSVAHNLMLGREPRRFGLVDEAKLEAEATQRLERFGLADRIRPATLACELGLGLKQMVEIVRALSHDARIVVLDEPAALLLPHERETLFAWLRSLRARDTACVYVSQRMDEIALLCDRVTVLRDGKTAATRSSIPPSRSEARKRYSVHDEIAAGGMATVHLGKLQGPFGFSSTVAIKRLHPQLAKDPQFVAMFLDEARLASRVRHPNVVPVLDVFAEEGELCLVMEYVAGESLAHLCTTAIERGAKVPVPIAVAVVSSVLHGLHAAHEACDEKGALLGLVHRDVSPQNVIVGADGVVRVIDFGIAKAAGRCNVSRDGQLKGKIAYMAPEQIQRGIVNRRTDVYGASVLLWELLVGERLFDGDAEGMILGRVLDDIVPRPSTLRTDLPIALDAIALRGLDRVQAKRFESARAMAQALEAVVRPATADEVGEWVSSLAHASLSERRMKLARLEQASVPPLDETKNAAAPDANSESTAASRDASRGGSPGIYARALVAIGSALGFSKMPAPRPTER